MGAGGAQARWEALRSAWALTRGRTLAPSARDAECEAFLHRQVSDDPPAVVEVALSPGELDRLLSPISRDQDLLTAETSSPFWLAATEIRLVPPVPASAVVGVQQVPRRVLPDLAAYLLGVAVPEYLAMVTSGRFGDVDGTEAYTRRPWFDAASLPQRIADAQPV